MADRSARVIEEEYRAARAAGKTAKADQLYGEWMRCLGMMPNSNAL